jgi:hypothetical protein
MNLLMLCRKQQLFLQWKVKYLNIGPVFYNKQLALYHNKELVNNNYLNTYEPVNAV